MLPLPSALASYAKAAALLTVFALLLSALTLGAKVAGAIEVDE